MPGGILGDNDYVENIVKGSGRGGRGGQGPGPGGTYGGGFGGGGFGGFGYQPGGFGTNPQMRKLQVQGPAGPVTASYPTNSFQMQQSPFSAAPSPKALNQAAPAGGVPNFGGIGDIMRRLQERQQAGAGGGYSPQGQLGNFENTGDPRSLANWLLSQYQGNGAFSPGGDPNIMRALQDNAARQGNQASQRAQLAANVSGMDPAQAAAYRARTDVASNTASQQGISDAMLQQLLSRQGFGDQLFGNMLGHSYGWDRGQQGFDFQNALQSQMRGGGLGQFLGGIGGSLLPGLGGLFGGGGGGAVGGGGGGYGGGMLGRPTHTFPQAY